MPLFSEAFGLAKSQSQLDFVDIPLNRDIPLFIDPFAISQRTDQWSRESHGTILVFFQRVIELIRANDEAAAVGLLSHLREPNETRLGFSKSRPQGAGIGLRQAHDLYNALKKSSAVQTGFLTSLADCELWVEGVGRDKISDLTTNVIRTHLVRYTQEQAKLHGVPVSEMPLPPQFDPLTEQWDARFVDIPSWNDAPIVLVPKAIARRAPAYSSNDYYENHILKYLQVHTPSGDASLVHTLKSGDVRVYKKALKEKYRKSKEFLFQFSQEHPEVLAGYRKQLETLEFSRRSDVDEADREKLVPPRLIRALRECPSGHEMALTYHSLIAGLLEVVFHPSLLYPIKIGEARGSDRRIDLQFQNGARAGPFKRLPDELGVPCANVHMECRNAEVGPEFPVPVSLLQRLGTNTGRVGLLITRRISDRIALEAHCRAEFRRSGNVVLPLDDTDLIRLLEGLRDGNRDVVPDRIEDALDAVCSAEEAGPEAARAAQGPSPTPTAAPRPEPPPVRVGLEARVRDLVSPSVAGALVTAVLSSRQDAQQGFLSGKCVLSNEVRTPRPSEAIGDLRLIEAWLNRDETLSLLAALESESPALAGQRLAGSFQAGTDPPVRRHSKQLPNYSGWPETVLELTHSSIQERIEILGTPLRRPGHEPVTGAEAIFNWVWKSETSSGVNWYGGEPPNISAFLVVIPDQRARVAAVTWLHTEVRAVVGATDSLDGLTIQRKFKPDSVADSLADSPVSGPEMSFPAPDGAESVRIALFARSGDLLDEALVQAPAFARTLPAISKTTAPALEARDGDVNSADVAILVALEEEFRHLFARIELGHSRETNEKTGRSFYRFSCKPADGSQEYRCVTTFVGSMGPTNTARLTGEMLTRYGPRTVVMVGIAGSLDKDVRVGDVVVADQVEDYLADAKAVPDTGSGFKFQLAGKTYRPHVKLSNTIRQLSFDHRKLLSSATAEAAEDLTRSIPPENLAKAREVARPEFDVIVGPIASGPVVGSAEPFTRWLRESANRKFVAIEMESAGVMNEVYEAAGDERVLVVRGISDLSDERKKELDAVGSGAFRGLAMRNAIRLVFLLMEIGALERA